jgi:hypothetical protein
MRCKIPLNDVTCGDDSYAKYLRAACKEAIDPWQS